MSWTRRGATIDGIQDTSEFGGTVVLSSDSNTLVVGAPIFDGTNTDEGQIRVYEWNGTTWNLRGFPFNINAGLLNGVSVGDRFGEAVDISDDGLTIIIGSRLNFDYTCDGGTVYAYRWNGTAWIQLGLAAGGNGSIAPTLAGELFGTSVSVSANGSITAVGSPLSSGTGFGIGRVYKYSTPGVAGGTWQQLGSDSDIQGDTVADTLGTKSALNDAGTILAISSSDNTGPTGLAPNTGAVKIFKYSTPGVLGGTWQQLGNNIYGEGANVFFGTSLSISADGNIVAIGSAVGAGGNGYVEVYQYSTPGVLGGTWQQLGRLEGLFVGDEFGSSVSLNKAGDKLAIGSKNLNMVGGAQVYQYSSPGVLGGAFVQIGSTVFGDADSSLGFSISMDGAGDAFAVGSPNGNNITNTASTGNARVFDIPDIIPPVNFGNLRSYDEQQYANLLSTNSGRFYGIFNSRVYDFTDFVAAVGTITPPQDVSKFLGTNPDSSAYITGLNVGDSNIYDVLDIFTTSATSQQISDRLDLYSIDVIGYYTPKIAYTFDEVIDNVLTPEPTQYIVNINQILYDITNDVADLISNFPAIMAGTNIDVFNRVNDNDTVTFPNLAQFTSAIVNSFSLGLSRYVRFGNNGQQTLTEEESQAIIDNIRNILDGLDGSTRNANAITSTYIIAGETNDSDLIDGQPKTIFQKVGPIMELLLTNSPGSVRIVNENGDVVTTNETGVLPYNGVLTNAKNNILEDLLTLQYESGRKECILEDVLSSSHNVFTSNRSNEITIEGAIIFYYSTSDVSLIADQVDIFVSIFGVRTIAIVYTGIDDNNGTLNIEDIVEDIQIDQSRLVEEIRKRNAGIVNSGNFIRCLVRYNTNNKNYTNLFTWDDPFADKVSLFQAVGKVDRKIPSNERGFRILITESDLVSKDVIGEIIYGDVPIFVPRNYVTNRTNNGSKTVSFSTAERVFTEERKLIKFKGTVNELVVGDVLYDDNTVRTTKLSARLLCSFNSSSSLALSIVDNEISMADPIRIQLGINPLNPVVKVNIINYVSEVDRNNYKTTLPPTTGCINVLLDDSADFIIDIDLPSFDLPIEKYSDYPRLGTVKIFAETGTAQIGTGLVKSLNSTNL